MTPYARKELDRERKREYRKKKRGGGHYAREYAKDGSAIGVGDYKPGVLMPWPYINFEQDNLNLPEWV